MIRLLLWVARAAIARWDDQQTHSARCACPMCRAWAHGYLQAAAEASMAADEDARFRRFLRAYEMPVEERR